MKKYNLAVEPGSSKKNKTGGWRNERPVFNHEKCTGCGTCERVCPEGVCFSTGQRNSKGHVFREADYDYCKGCGLCARECPFGAIKMKKEVK